MGVIAIAAAALVMWLLLRNANVLCTVTIRDGTAALVGGRAPERFLVDLAEIARHDATCEATLRIVSESGAPTVQTRGRISAETVQRVRNVTAGYRVAHFRSGRPPRARRAERS